MILWVGQAQLGMFPLHGVGQGHSCSCLLLGSGNNWNILAGFSHTWCFSWVDWAIPFLHMASCHLVVYHNFHYMVAGSQEGKNRSCKASKGLALEVRE